MIVAIMQPYLFPYIGYWQLINAVDTFVLLDDVSFIKRGYINRNEILLNQKRYRFTIPIEKASQNKLIMDTKFVFDDQWKKVFLKTVEIAYKKAPYYDAIMPLLQQIIEYKEVRITEFIFNSIRKINEYIGINTNICISSQISKNNSLRAELRIIEICKRIGGNVYINPCGGRQLYHYLEFEKENIKLLFLDSKMDQIRYFQNQKNFEGGLSIIDILMFNDKKQINRFLGEYILNEQ